MIPGMIDRRNLRYVRGVGLPRLVARLFPKRAVRRERHKSQYAFVFGPVAVVVRYWEERLVWTEAGARVDLRRVEPVTGKAHRDGAAGFCVLPVAGGGIWRADLFTMVSGGDGKPHHHFHPRFTRTGVGERAFDPTLSADPVGWTMARLTDLRGLLIDAGAGDVVDRVDYDEHQRALPLIRRAIEACMTPPPRPHRR